MAKRLTAILLAASFGVAAAGIVACGGEKQGELLSEAEARGLLEDLDRVQARFDSDDCKAALGAVTQAEADADSLGPEVDNKLKQKIADGLERLRTLLDDECKTTTTKTTKTETTPTATVPTVTTPTETTETTPTTDTTETTDTTDTGTTTEPVPPPDDGTGGIEPPADGGGAEGGE